MNENQTYGTPTGIPRRLGAFFYDLLLIMSLWMVTLWAWILINDGEAIYGSLVQLVLMMEFIAFYIYCWTRTGQTLGMRAWKIKIVDVDGENPTLKQSIVRLIVLPVSWSVFGLGFFWFYFSKTQQTWHDRFSRTFTVKLSEEKTG